MLEKPRHHAARISRRGNEPWIAENGPVDGAVLEIWVSVTAVFFLRVDNGNPVDELAAFMQVRFRRDAGRNGNPGKLTAERLS